VIRVGIWEDIEYQKEMAIGSDEEYKKFLEETLDDPLKKYFQESWDKKIPLEYHTEAVSKPVYHPLVISRVLVYFNPYQLKGKKKYRDLKEYSFKWFGMSLECLKKYVEKGWVIVQLNTEDKYDGDSRNEINEFFRNLKARPIYVNIVDDLLPSFAGEDKTLESILSEEKNRVKDLHERWLNIVKKPIKLHGVVINADKVMENYLKLKLLRDVFENKGDQKTANGINIELKFLEESKNPIELAQRAYSSFLIYGTPILYCNGSGFVSVGSEPYWYIVQANTKTILGKIKGFMRRITSKITRKNEKILYFDDIKKPHEIIRNHFELVNQGRYEKVKEQEEDIKLMIEKVYARVNEKGTYVKALGSYENEVRGVVESKLKKITVPLSIGNALLGSITEGIIGILMAFTPLLTESRPIKTIALKCVAGNRIFGIEIEEKEIPDLGVEIPEAYKDIRFRVLKIPVENKDHTSEEITTVELSDKV
jgi:hypothetical protein